MLKKNIIISHMQDYKNACIVFHLILTSDYNWIYYWNLRSPTYAKILQSQLWSPVLLSLISAYLPVLWTLILEHVYNTIQGGWTMFNLSTKNKAALMTWSFVVAKAHDACTSWRYLVAKLSHLCQYEQYFIFGIEKQR